MSIDKAKAHYAGKDGHRKMNCAQTIMHAFKEKFAVSEEAVNEFAAYGGGKAPGGCCGSLHAARVLLEKKNPEKFKACENELYKRAGSLSCKEIRGKRKLSCMGCVETIASCLESI